MEKKPVALNIIYFFFDDDFLKDPLRNKIESFVDTNHSVTIIGIAYPVTLCTLLFNTRRFVKFLFNPKGKVREKVFYFAPFGIFPLRMVNKSQILKKIHKWFFKIQINNYLGSLGFLENKITWIFDLSAFSVCHDVVTDSKLLVYPCDDEYTMKENTLIKDMEQLENQLLYKADIVFAVSKNIYATRKEKNKNCYFIPNGVDFSFFSKASYKDTLAHEELRNLPRPIVGYLGNTRSWLDFELLEFLADALPEVSFVFVGPIQSNVKKNVDSLKKRPNVYFLARKDRVELPSILKGFDVCLIPFKYNKFNLATDPLKFWEYLATGKPIVSLRIPDLELYEDVVSLYLGKDEALAKLNTALIENDPKLKERRMQIARENDISLRSKQYYEILLRHLLDEKNRCAQK